MLGLLIEFVEELRAVGVPVSMVETLDAADALRHVDLSDPAGLRAALGATLVKNERHFEAFRVAFDVFFGLKARSSLRDDGDDAVRTEQAGIPGGGGAGAGQGADGEGDALFDAIAGALEAGDHDRLRRLVARAVRRYAGIEPGRPVGGRYYFYRVMRRLDPDALLERLQRDSRPDDRLDSRITFDAAQDRLDELLTEVRREIVRRLVED